MDTDKLIVLGAAVVVLWFVVAVFKSLFGSSKPKLRMEDVAHEPAPPSRRRISQADWDELHADEEEAERIKAFDKRKERARAYLEGPGAGARGDEDDGMPQDRPN